MTETLLDRSANLQVEDGESLEKDGTTELMSEITVRDGGILFRTLSTEHWRRLASLPSLATTDVEKKIESVEKQYNVSVPDDIIEQLEIIEATVRCAWDAEAEMFYIHYNTNKKGQIHQLYVPLSSSHTDDVVLETIYTADGEFVADHVEDALNKNIHKLEVYDIYVKNPFKDKPQLYLKSTTTFKEAVETRFRNSEEPFDSLEEIGETWLLAVFISVTPLFGYAIAGGVGFLLLASLLTLAYGLYVFSVLFVFIIPLQLLYYGVQEKKKPLYVYEELFTAEGSLGTKSTTPPSRWAFAADME